MSTEAKKEETPATTTPVNSTPATTEKKETGIKGLFQNPMVMKRVEEILGKRAATFATSVIQIVNSSALLKEADPTSILNAAMVAATLDLPLNNQLGFAWIVPYKENKQDKETGKWNSRVVAQFQIGYRGFIQLAQRTGQYARLNCVPVYENQFKSWNSLTEEMEADFNIEGTGKVVGYCAYFKMLNGFEKTIYWSKERATEHGKTYSKSFGSGPWKDKFDEMAMKSLLRSILGKWGMMSVDIQKAMTTDQAVVKTDTGEEVEYVDHEVIDDNKEVERFLALIADSGDRAEINMYFQGCTPEVQELVKEEYEKRIDYLDQIEDSKGQKKEDKK